MQGSAEEKALLAESPVPLGRRWHEYVNEPQSEAEVEAIRRSVQRGQPFGGEAWQAKFARRLGLEHTFRPRGRPRKQTGGKERGKI
jgi:putative transposase